MNISSPSTGCIISAITSSGTYPALKKYHASEIEESNPIGQCDTTTYTYTAHIESVFQSNCATSGCHDGQTGIGGVQFSSYLDVKNKVDAGRITARMIDGTCGFMPPSGQLDTATINMVQQWMNEGSCE